MQSNCKNANNKVGNDLHCACVGFEVKDKEKEELDQVKKRITTFESSKYYELILPTLEFLGI